MNNPVSRSDDFGDKALAIDSLPKTALQAIYHAVTGKTENISKTINGNVIIDHNSISRLYGMIKQQMEHYQVESGPTVTIVVKKENNKNYTYSSWERFNSLKIDDYEITSEISLKVEFIFTLPDTEKPQRFTISINIDSALPLLKEKQDSRFPVDAFPFYFLMVKEWRTVEISVDYVDFLFAKVFISLVEEWFKTVDKCPSSPFSSSLMKHFDTISNIINNMGRIGMGFYILLISYFVPKSEITLSIFATYVSIGIIVWGIYTICTTPIKKYLFDRLSSNIIPSVIILNGGDKRAHDAAISKVNNPTVTFFGIFLAIIGNLTINLLASYIWNIFHKG